MIQDIAPLVFHNEYHNTKPEPDSRILCYQEECVLLRMEAAKRFLSEDNKKLKDSQSRKEDLLPEPLSEKEIERLFPTYQEIGKVFGVAEALDYGFLIGKQSYFVHAAVPGELDAFLAQEGFSWFPLRIFRSIRPHVHAFAGISGSHLYHFRRDNRYCGRCGRPMEYGRKERSMVCTACGNIEYPKISPAVIVGVYDKERLLLSKYAGREYKKYSLIAGFCEFGESFVDTLRRELMEEVGLKVKNIRYYKSQPWAFTQTMLAGFFAELDGKKTITLEEEELSEAEWFSREELPYNPSQISLTNEMIEYFRNHPEAFEKEEEEI